MSSTSSPASTVTALDCIARANPAISLAVSPFARSSTKNAAICVESASSSASIAACASSSDKSAPSHKSSITFRRSTAARLAVARATTARPARPFPHPRARSHRLARIVVAAIVALGPSIVVARRRRVAVVTAPRVAVAAGALNARIALGSRAVFARRPRRVPVCDARARERSASPGVRAVTCRARDGVSYDARASRIALGDGVRRRSSTRSCIDKKLAPTRVAIRRARFAAREKTAREKTARRRERDARRRGPIDATTRERTDRPTTDEGRRTTDEGRRKGSLRRGDVVGTGGDAGAGEPERGLSGGESAERWDKLAVVVADGEFFGGDGVGRRRA
jgi:hypothetical protein